MSDKKNIDRLFQEKFKDFEAAPPEFIWENIREVLEEKKKKRVVPLWFRLGGVAAVIAIATLLGNLYLDSWDDGKTAPAVTTSPGNNQAQPPLKALPTDVNAKGNGVIDRRDNPSGPVNSIVVNGDGKGEPKGKNSNVLNNAPAGTSTQIKTRTDLDPQDDALVNHNPNKVDNKNSTPGKKHDPSQQDNAVANANNLKNKGIVKGVKSNSVTNPDTAVANNSASYKKSVKENTSAKGGLNPAKNSVANNGNQTPKGKDNGTGGALDTTKNNQNNGYLKPNSTVANSTNKTKGNIVNGKDDNGTTITNSAINSSNGVAGAKDNEGTATNVASAVVIDTTTPLPNDAVAETKIDTAAVAPENELEKLLREQQENKDAEKDKVLADTGNKNKWNIKPQVAPVFYNSFSNGSPIDAQFTSNAKTYDNDLSVGLGVNYAVTNRITIRSGVNTVNLNYATQGVEFYASMDGQTNNIAARSSNANIVVQDQTRGNTLEVFFADKLPVETFNGAMVQRTGYIEVPVEMSYALLNKKFGIDIIGGVSTLFLNQNNVSVVSVQGYTTSVGEAQNLNNIHFSTNVGLGFKYRFFKSFEANFEPMFKYQVNTFSRDAGNFKPYFIGLYSGISFSF
jgi:hypothetical protein